ncbi:hypothetical protein PHMEG_00021496 [Phytophthora megakarya]|uniref:Uncharacterized protein n=1 Tax=Phytophthora megakarya TaxID=4795 RepID=A0A225VLG7_9STRA|nr:hypothetical protein PHMEG_00021496 [Phytophthora megakarya]
MLTVVLSGLGEASCTGKTPRTDIGNWNHIGLPYASDERPHGLSERARCGFGDNKAAISTVKNPSSHNDTKHI